MLKLRAPISFQFLIVVVSKILITYVAHIISVSERAAPDPTYIPIPSASPLLPSMSGCLVNGSLLPKPILSLQTQPFLPSSRCYSLLSVQPTCRFSQEAAPDDFSRYQILLN